MRDFYTTTFTRYENASDVTGDFLKAKPIQALYEATRTDSAAKRAARSATDADALRRAKASLPMWYTGGSCFETHNADTVCPCGCVSIDLDHIEGADRQSELKARLAAIPCVFFVAISASGRGLYALASVSVEVQTDPDAVMRFYEIVDAVVFTDRRGGEKLDTACKDIARRRFESYDAATYYSPESAANEYTGDVLARCNAAYERSTLASLARLFGGKGDCGPGSSQAGLALAALATAAGGRVSGRVFTKDFYPSRGQVVILGSSGDGKSTAARALRKAANGIGARPVSPESDRALELALVESGLELGKDDDGESVWTQRQTPIPLLAICDEAGDEQASRRAREYKSRMNAIRRRTFDTLFHASASLSTKLPQIDFRCSYTEVQLSTPKRWADALRGTDKTTGEQRRVLEFWADGTEAPEGALNPELALFAVIGAEVPEPAKTEAIEQVMQALKDALPIPNADGDSLRLDGLRALSDFDAVQALNVIPRDMQSRETTQDARTMVCGLATLIAWSNGETERIPADAIEAAWAVVASVYANRARLADIAEVANVSQESEITTEILDYIGSRELRASSVKRMLARRGPTYLRAYTALVQAGALIVGKGKSPTVRQATASEAEASIEASADEAPTTAKRQAGPSVWDGDVAYSRGFFDCDAIEQKQRLAKYVAKFETDNPLVEGQRDNNLRKLRGELDKVWSPVTEAFFFDTCDRVGFTSERDKHRLARPIRQSAPTA